MGSIFVLVSTKYIYALSDGSGRPRYVGQTQDPKARLCVHKYYRGPKTTPVKRWLARLKEEGREPVMKILLACEENQADELELKVIQLFARRDPTLLNKVRSNWQIGQQYLTKQSARALMLEM